MAMSIIDILYNNAELGKQIKQNFKPVFTKQEYLAKLDSYFSKE